MKDNLIDIITEFKKNNGNISFLVGAGLSAESGIPTFRGKDGFWRVGSVNYTPEQMATYAFFSKNPDAVWSWYIYRLFKYINCEPNEGHRVIAEIENLYKNRFSLITQNIDGLTYRAGNSSERSYPIHGSINYVRCSKMCTKKLYKTPVELPEIYDKYGMGPEIHDRLKCPECGALLRPHILFFDECYDEQYYKFESVIHKAGETDLLIVVGTTGATNLPYQVVGIVNYNNKPIININPHPEEMYDYLRRASDVVIKEKSSTALKQIFELLK